MHSLNKTPLHNWHAGNGGKMVDFSGWSMPIQYAGGIVQEHLATRRHAGLFDVSHMGRFMVSGPGAVDFLQYSLTNNAATLQPGLAHYTLLANETGGAVDDAYLYHFDPGQYLLVVNAGNKDKDYQHLKTILKQFPTAQLDDISGTVAMIALQGPDSKTIIRQLDPTVILPKDGRNHCCNSKLMGIPLQIGTTGYTGEPGCYELFVPSDQAVVIWQALASSKLVSPIGLGARDTLRLEAALPLYGHEFGLDNAGHEIPVLSCPTALFAIDKDKSIDFIGKKAIHRQLNALNAMKSGDYSLINDLPRRLRCFALTDKGIARAQCLVYHNGQPAGYVTSGTMAPYWIINTNNGQPIFTDQTALRAIGLALVDSRLTLGDTVAIQIRANQVNARLTKNPVNNRSTSICLPVL